jgi:Leucine rich repeat
MNSVLLVFLPILLFPVVIGNFSISCNKHQKICEIQHISNQDEHQPPDLTAWLGQKFERYLYIKITKSHIQKIPLELVSAFPNLTSLSAVDCGLKSIEKDAIPTKLHHLILPSNEIAVLEDDTFGSGSELRTIDLSRNMITVVAGQVFRWLVNLNTLNLSYNRIATLENGTFSRLERLISLKLGHNAIQVIEI